MARAKAKSAPTKAAVEKPPHTRASRKPPLAVLREWSDALVIAFLLAMFIRTFTVELFKIPSGSMTPTLVGTGFNEWNQPEEYVIEWDLSVPPDGEKELILDRGRYRFPRYHIFYREGGKYVRNEERHELALPLEALRQREVRDDRIIVNKFIYWFRAPRRGEIVVFRVPPLIYQRDKPIYIKRLVGLPGERVEIRPPHVYINGERLEEPEIFRLNEYVARFGEYHPGESEKRPSYIEWHVEKQGFHAWDVFDGAQVPDRHYFMLGDNSKSSRDSRDWGAVPEANLKGKAILRYWPLKNFGFLK